MGFLVEHLDEGAPNDLALLFRVNNPRERTQKALLRLDANDTHTEMLSEGAHHLVALAQAKQTVINEHTHQLVANRTMQKRSDNGRINSARQPQQDFAGANLSADAIDRIL